MKIKKLNLVEKILLGIGLGVGLASSFIWLGGNNKEKEIPKEITIPISGYGYFPSAKDYVRYCGMPNEKHFSLSSLWSTTATNIYYPINAKQINFLGNNYKLISVDPNQITLR